MKNIFIARASGPSRLLFDKEENRLLPLQSEPVFMDNQDLIENKHVYITSLEDIEEGDWFIFYSKQLGWPPKVYRHNGLDIHKFIKVYEDMSVDPSDCDRIVLTTDPKLIEDEVQEASDEFLQWLTQNPSCEEVEVFYGLFNSMGRQVDPSDLTQNQSGCYWKYKVELDRAAVKMAKRKRVKKRVRNIFLFSTSEPSRLKGEGWNLELSSKALKWREAKHLYITSDEKIKEGDWICNAGFGVFKSKNSGDAKSLKKIILSTDPSLISSGVQEIDDEFIHWLVENPFCEFVKTYLGCCGECDERLCEVFDLQREKPTHKIIIPNRQEPDEGISYNQDLQKESEKYANINQIDYSNSFIDIRTRDFIAGANSKFVKTQVIQSQIDCLQGILDKTSHLKDDGPTRYFVLMELQSLNQKLNK